MNKKEREFKDKIKKCIEVKHDTEIAVNDRLLQLSQVKPIRSVMKNDRTEYIQKQVFNVLSCIRDDVRIGSDAMKKEYKLARISLPLYGNETEQYIAKGMMDLIEQIAIERLSKGNISETYCYKGFKYDVGGIKLGFTHMGINMVAIFSYNGSQEMYQVTIECYYK